MLSAISLIFYGPPPLLFAKQCIGIHIRFIYHLFSCGIQLRLGFLSGFLIGAGVALVVQRTILMRRLDLLHGWRIT